MPNPEDIDELNEQLRDRLQFLLKEHSQAEIARRTGHSLSNVSRYVSGTRMPASFIAGLVQGLDVDPDWLLTGAGDARRSDISGRAQERATDLIEIVEALAAVQKMRLGSLTAKSHLRVLRDLNDGLARHDRLQQKLNEISKPVFKQMLDDLDNALQNYDLDRAIRIRETATQVSRFCNDFELIYRFYPLQARCEFGKGRPEAAADLLRQQFLFSMMRVGSMGNDDLSNLIRFAVTVHSQGREKEAIRSLRAVRAMLTEEQMNWEEAQWLGFLAGQYRFLAGELRDGMAEMQKHYPSIIGAHRRGAAITGLTGAMLYSGVMSVEEALNYGGPVEAKIKWVLDFCALFEDREGLRLGVDRYDKPEVVHVKGQSLRTEASRIILMGLEGDSKEALKRWAKFEETLKPHDPIVQLHRRIVVTALLRYDRQWKRALNELEQADVQLAELDPEYTIGTFWILRHYRNALALHEQGKEPPTELVERAWDFIQEKYDAGYVSLRNWLRNAAPE